MYGKRLTFARICLRYDLNRSTIQTWMRKIRQGISLENKQRGRTPKAPMPRPKKKRTSDRT